jgi:hypothetical protein
MASARQEGLPSEANNQCVRAYQEREAINMYRWLWLGLIVVPIVLLSGCGGSDNTISPGEGTGLISADDFDPFGEDAGPLNLRYFTAPSAGTYQLILSSGPDQPPLPQPWVMVFAGRVDENNVSFLGAYNSGHGVLAENHGINSTQVIVNADADEEFTFSFGSWSDGTGNYSWHVVKL